MKKYITTIIIISFFVLVGVGVVYAEGLGKSDKVKTEDRHNKEENLLKNIENQKKSEIRRIDNVIRHIEDRQKREGQKDKGESNKNTPLMMRQGKENNSSIIDELNNLKEQVGSASTREDLKNSRLALRELLVNNKNK